MSINLHALKNVPLVEPGDDIAKMIRDLLLMQFDSINDGDTLVIAQKVISKAENRYVRLNDITPSERAHTIAAVTGKDPRYIQVVLYESSEVLCYKKGIVIVEHKLGFVHANAGIDESNIEQDTDNPQVLLLPKNPDRSAYLLQHALMRYLGKKLNIVISDSTGRAFRNGICGIAIGSAGFKALSDLYGNMDLYGNVLVSTQVATADELASAASLLMGQGAEACPIVLMQGTCLEKSEQGADILMRPKYDDMFRSQRL